MKIIAVNLFQLKQLKRRNLKKFRLNFFRFLLFNCLRVNVSKNQRKTVKSRPRSKNRFRSFFVYSKFKVLNKMKWG